ncbi:hypothetical protein [Oligosphaera ethanolica]|uniref:Uncharacterized protein n=1 Tax=Oligosphaera ethanolica TaxID=760260 RepID=A0AAE3VJM8_9BACT|nr:hypothetical protein [Oligosphaera ethanolica]MDQ0291630.1 hypothetical protein [Oligosphaera ethanolica]
MTTISEQLQGELEDLRRDEDFMLQHMKKMTISRALGFGNNLGIQWMRTTKTMVDGKSQWRSEYLSCADVFRSVDMRELLVAVFWLMQGRGPMKKAAMAEIAPPSFWLEFLHVAREAKWQGQKVHLALVSTASCAVPAHIRLASWIYLLERSPRALSRAGLDAEGFELEQVRFDARHEKRWRELTAMGVEAMFEKRCYQASFASDISPVKKADWFSFAILKHCLEIVCMWLENFSEAELGMTYRDILIYAVGHYRGVDAAILVKKLEELRPGLCTGFRDRHGNNLLWYTATCWQPRKKRPKGLTTAQAYQLYLQSGKSPLPPAKWVVSRQAPWEEVAQNYTHLAKEREGSRNLLKLLCALGVSPQAPNALGFSFQDLDDYASMVGKRWQILRINTRLPGFADSKAWKRPRCLTV